MNKQWWHKPDIEIIRKALKLAAVAGLVVALAVLFFVGKFSTTQKLTEGEVSQMTLYAPYDFHYEKGIDEEKTRRLREETAKNVYPVFVSSSVFNTMLMPFKEKLAVLLDSFDLATQDPQRFNQKLLDFASGLDKDEISYLLSLKPDELKNFLQSLDRILNGLSNFLILSDEDLAYLASSKLEKITFFKPDSNSEVVYNVNLLFSLKQAKDKLFTLIQDECKDRKKDAAIAQKLLTAFIRPTIERNQAMTDEKVNAAIKALPLQVKMEEVKKDEIIVSKGERLNKETVQKLLVLFKKQEKLQFYSFLTGNILFLLLVLLVGVFFIRWELPRVY